MWQQFLKDYFNFSKKGREGVLYFVAIILVLIILPFFFPFFIKKEKIDHSEFEKEIAQLKVDSSRNFFSKNEDHEFYDDYTPAKYKYGERKSEVFFFDPNTASVDDWLRLGIKPRTAQTIQKYISKGGKFYKPEDIKKIWGLSSADVERLMPYVSIKNVKKEFPIKTEKVFVEKPFTNVSHPPKTIDVNLADTSGYIALPGIGSKLSKRIIAFREKLGGFYSTEQIAETYLLPDSTFQKIKPYLVIKNPSVKKININTASVDEMKSHPYLRYNMANAIFQYRQQHGNYKTIEDLKKIMTVTEEFFNKASPYLTVE